MSRIFKYLYFASLLITFQSCHVGRYFVYNFANISDYKKFQEREINAAEKKFEFYRNVQPEMLENEYTKNRFTTIKGLEFLLENNKSVAFMVLHKDTIKYEWYTDKWSNDDIVTSFSMSKSVISALIGIALEEGAIKSVNDPITDYIKIFKNKGFEKITIQHLLDMRTGIDYKETYYNPFGNVAVGYYGRNLDRHISNLKVKGEPGQEFEYISISTQLLGVIIEEATGKTVSSYLEEKIWSKIGTEFSATWSVDRKNGREKSFCCLNAHVEDFAKFAKLYLNKGTWMEEQIIPKDWIEKSIQLHPETEDSFYQNQWWLWGPSDNEHPKEVTYAAQGHLGQLMYIDPVKEIIILRFGKQWGQANWRTICREISKSF